MDGPTGFRELLAPWASSGYARINDGKYKIHFANGSIIHLRYCKRYQDVTVYQGTEIHLLLIDELTHHEKEVYHYLRGRVRMAGVRVPEQFKGMFPRILCASNPGNIGHQWVKENWVNKDPNGTGKIWKAPPEEGGMLRQFIPAKLEDNPSLHESDPLYEHRLMGLGDESLVKALREGDWDIVAGAFFGDCFSAERKARIIIPPFPVPPQWRRFMSFDWGSDKPFSIGFYAVADGNTVTHADRTYFFPKGSLIRYSEYYGAQKDRNGRVIANEGCRWTNREIGKLFAKLCFAEKFSGSVADPSIFTEQGGPSIFEQMRKGAKAEGYTLRFQPADNERVAGWQNMRTMLREAGKSRPEGPGLWVFDTNIHWIRTVLAVPRDERKTDDVDTKSEDHIADECRYACMAVRDPAGRMKVKMGGA